MSIKTYVSNSLGPDCEPEKTDVGEIGGVVSAIYNSISFPAGGEPQYERFRSLFAPHARLTHAGAEEASVVDVVTFIERFKETVNLGILKSLREKEIKRKTYEFGSIVHVFSSYEAEAEGRSGRFKKKGLNSIQMFRANGRYWVISLLWDDERETLELPPEFS